MEKEEQKAYHRYIRGIILIGLAMLLFKLLVTGNIYNFIAPKMIKYVYSFCSNFNFWYYTSLGRWKRKTHDCNCCKHHTTSKSGIKVSLYMFYLLFR